MRESSDFREEYNPVLGRNILLTLYIYILIYQDSELTQNGSVRVVYAVLTNVSSGVVWF